MLIFLDEIEPSGGLERLAVNAKVATVLGSIPASFGTVDSGIRWAADEAVSNNVHEKRKNPKNTPLILFADLEGLRIMCTRE